MIEVMQGPKDPLGCVECGADIRQSHTRYIKHVCRECFQAKGQLVEVRDAGYDAEQNHYYLLYDEEGNYLRAKLMLETPRDDWRTWGPGSRLYLRPVRTEGEGRGVEGV